MAPSNKMFPAATHEDQEGIVKRELGQPIKIGTPPFSSPDPATEGKRMVPILDDVTGEQGHEMSSADPSQWKANDFKTQVSAATTDEELDAVEQQYLDSGKDYSSVETAVEKRREELAEEAKTADDDDNSDV